MSSWVTICKPVTMAPRWSEGELLSMRSDENGLSVPRSGFPRPMTGSAVQRAKLRLPSHGQGIHRPDLDEELSVGGLLERRPPAELRSLVAS